MIETNENYWDCNCEEDFIHERAKKKYCAKCNSLHFNQPDSRQDEIDLDGEYEQVYQQEKDNE